MENQNQTVYQKMEGKTKHNEDILEDSFRLFRQNIFNYIPRVDTRLQYLGNTLPISYFDDFNPSVMDRQIRKFIIQVDSVMSINISLHCGSCTKLKNDCNCEKSHYIIKPFVNLMGRCEGIPIKLCLRRMDAIFKLLDFSHEEKVSLIGYLIKFDKFTYGMKDIVKFKDLKYPGIFNKSLQC